jgi:hypothetical protein
VQQYAFEDPRPSLLSGYIVTPSVAVQSAGAMRSLLDIPGDLAPEAAVAALIVDRLLP